MILILVTDFQQLFDLEAWVHADLEDDRKFYLGKFYRPCLRDRVWRVELVKEDEAYLDEGGGEAEQTDGEPGVVEDDGEDGHGGGSLMVEFCIIPIITKLFIYLNRYFYTLLKQTVQHATPLN